MSLLSFYNCFFVLVFITSCGNPITLEKDLKSEEDRRKSAEQTSTELSDKVTLLKNYLTHLYVSTNNVWVFAGITQSYDKAKSLCADIGYTLPESYDIDEFRDEILPSHPEWSKYIDQFPINGESSPSQTDSTVVLCRTGRK